MRAFSVRICNLMPFDARRPHYQSGFLVGSFPDALERGGHQNLARRLLGKFRIPADRRDGFWTPAIPPLPGAFLLPAEDKVGSWIAGLPRPDADG